MCIRDRTNVPPVVFVNKKTILHIRPILLHITYYIHIKILQEIPVWSLETVIVDFETASVLALKEVYDD